MNRIRWCQRFPAYTLEGFDALDDGEYRENVVILDALDKVDQHQRERAERRARRVR